MNIQTHNLKTIAEIARDEYRQGKISKEQAKENIMPYIKEVNKKATELAKKYNVKPQKINFESYVR